MKKTSTKKLSLSRETVAQLDVLRGVVAGESNTG